MPYTAINVTMELISAIVLLVLIISMLQRKMKTRQDRLFLLVLVFCMCYMLCDTMAWALNEKPGLLPLFLTRTGNFLVFIFGSLGSFFLMAYTIFSASQKDNVTLRSVKMMWVMGALSILLLFFTVLNLFNGMLYAIDDSNQYHWGEWYPLPHLVFLAQGGVLMIEILRCRKPLGRRATWTLLSYVLLPAVAIVINIWQYLLMLHFPAIMVALLLIYVNFQQEQEKKLHRQELELTNSSTAIMLSQIQPHFLYNTLTTISDLCVSDSEQAQQTVLDFSDYLRTNLNSLSTRELVCFEDELNHVTTYLSLEKKRFEERLQIEYDIEVQDFRLPPLSLQPIVENAVLHGVTTRSAGGTVRIQTMRIPGGVRITVTDDGVGFDPAAPPDGKRPHIGIENVRKRLMAMCGGSLTVESKPGEGTTVSLFIPQGGVA